MEDTKSEKMDKVFILEKIFANYQMQVARSERLEAKTSGYYTILGIYFTAFVVIDPFLLETALLINYPTRKTLVLFIWVFTALFLTFFFMSISLLHDKYEPKERIVFAPEKNWDDLLSQSKENAIISMKDNLSTLLHKYKTDNEKTAHTLKLVNKFCLFSAIIIATCFLFLLALLYISKGGIIYGR